MNKLCGVLFDGRDADRVILVYANLCNNLLFGKSLRAFLCLDQLLQKLDFQTVYKVYTLHGFLSKNRKNCESCPVSLLIVRSQTLSCIHVLKCKNCDQCLKHNFYIACYPFQKIIPVSAWKEQN